jgi:hypothetical protein
VCLLGMDKKAVSGDEHYLVILKDMQTGSFVYQQKFIVFVRMGFLGL